MERVTLAHWLSILFHPFVMIGVMVGAAAATRETRGEAVRSVGTVVLFTVIPLAVLMWRQVRRGRWENADASNKRDRPILYVVVAVAIAALLVYLLVVRSQSFMVRGVVGTLGMIAVCGLVTRWIKVSLHMAFAALAGTALVLMPAPLGYALLVALPALAWSRVALNRHTPLEVATGTIIGAGTGAAIRYL